MRNVARLRGIRVRAVAYARTLRLGCTPAQMTRAILVIFPISMFSLSISFRWGRKMKLISFFLSLHKHAYNKGKCGAKFLLFIQVSLRCGNQQA